MTSSLFVIAVMKKMAMILFQMLIFCDTVTSQYFLKSVIHFVLPIY
jgi:hypothetical protein